MSIPPKSNRDIIDTKQHINYKNVEAAKTKASGNLGQRLVNADIGAVNNINRQLSTSSVESGYISDDSIYDRSTSDQPVEKVQKTISCRKLLSNFTRHFRTLQSEVFSILPSGDNIGWMRCGRNESRYPTAFAKAWKHYDSDHTFDPFKTDDMALDLTNIAQKLGISAIQNDSPSITSAKYTMQPRVKLANEEICELVQIAVTYIILLYNDIEKANTYIQVAQEYCAKIDKDEYIYKDLQDTKHDLKINMVPVWNKAKGITPIKKKS